MEIAAEVVEIGVSEVVAHRRPCEELAATQRLLAVEVPHRQCGARSPEEGEAEEGEGEGEAPAEDAGDAGNSEGAGAEEVEDEDAMEEEAVE